MSTVPTFEGHRQAVEQLSQGSVSPARCEIVRDFSRLEALAPDWDRLWAADKRGEVFQSYRWNRAWWQAFGKDLQLCTPVVFFGSEVAGILPLVRRGERLELLGYPQADYGDVICAEESTGRVLECSLRGLQEDGNWREALLDGLPSESRIVRHAPTLLAPARACFRLMASENCYTILLGEKHAEILDSLARKQHLRRRQNKLEKSGKVVFRHLESIPEALHQLEMFFVCQRRRRLIQGKSSAAESEEFRQLLRNLVQDFDLKRELHFGVLELDAKPLAWHLSFETNDKLVFYQQTFDVDAWDLAPGEGLLRNLLLFAKGRVRREFDFTRGDEPFKARFGNHERTIYRMWLQRRGARGQILGAARSLQGAIQRLAERVRRAAKAEKAIFERWRSLRTWFGNQLQWLDAGQTTARQRTANPHNFFGGKIWENESHILLTTGASSPLAATVSPGIAIAGASLGDLVDFAQQHSHVISPTSVLEFRERFRQGDRAIIARRGTELVRVGWLSTRPLRELYCLSQTTPQSEPALILYELWDGCAGDAQDELHFLNNLLYEAETLRLPLWITCNIGSEGFRSALARREFRPKLVIRRLKVLGGTIRESISEA